MARPGQSQSIESDGNVCATAAVVTGAIAAAVLAPRGGASPGAASSGNHSSAPDPVPSGWYSSSIAQAYGATGPGVVAGVSHGVKVVVVSAANGAQCVLGISGPHGSEAVTSTCSNSTTLGETGGQPFVLGAPDGTAVRGAALSAGDTASSATAGVNTSMAGRVALVPENAPNQVIQLTTGSWHTIAVPAYPHG